MIQVPEALGLSYKSANQLNKLIDTQLPGQPKFTQKEIVMGGEVFDVYFQDIIKCIRSLYGDPNFAPYLVFAPERHYADKDKTIQLFHDMLTGKWWWATQVCHIYLNP